MKKITLLVWVVGGVCLTLFVFFQVALAEESPGKKIYTLAESIAEALEKNWSLKAVDEKRNQATNKKNQARSDLLPRFKTQYGYTRLDDVSNFESSLGRDYAVSSKDNYQWVNSVSQPVFAGFGLISSYRFAKLGIDQAEMEMELSRLDLALQVKEAYFNVLVMDKTVDVLEKEVAFLSSNLEMTRHFYDKGLIPVNDLLKAEMELADAVQKLLDAKNQAAVSRSVFITIMARPVNEPLDVKDILIYQPETVDLQENIDKAMETRPEIKIIDINLKQAEEQVKIAGSAYYPSVSLNYNFIKEGDNADVSGSPYHDADRWEVTAVCSMTLWEWGKSYYAVNEKKSAVEEIIKNRNALADSIMLDVKEAKLYLDTAEKNIPATQKAVQQGEENLRVNEQGYRAQMNTMTEVLDAQALLTRARVNHYKALYFHNLAKAKLLRAIGTY
ncbi:MAG: TolC family protein [Desulfotignum sp.]